MDKIANTWSHELPTTDGFFWFRDIDRDEQGIALVSAVNRSAEILIWSTTLDERTYVSSAYWTEDETTNDNWEWIPIELPKDFYLGNRDF